MLLKFVLLFLLLFLLPAVLLIGEHMIFSVTTIPNTPALWLIALATIVTLLALPAFLIFRDRD